MLNVHAVILYITDECNISHCHGPLGRFPPLTPDGGLAGLFLCLRLCLYVVCLLEFSLFLYLCKAALRQCVLLTAIYTNKFYFLLSLCILFHVLCFVFCFPLLSSCSCRCVVRDALLSHLLSHVISVAQCSS